MTVVECGSFSAAAERLGYTQSAVSQHISALENDLGTPLLRRRPVAPTPAGERLLEHAAPILLRLATARADVRRTLARPATALTLATTPLATSGATSRATTGATSTAPSGTTSTAPSGANSTATSGVPTGATSTATPGATSTAISGATSGANSTATTGANSTATPGANSTSNSTATPGATSGAAAQPGALAVALREVRRSHPGIEVTLTVCGRDEVVEGVAAGTFAVGLVDGVAAPSDPLRLSDALHLRTTPVAHDDLIVALPNDHPLAGRRGLSLHDLADARWIDAPDLAAPLPVLRATVGSDGFRPAFTYAGTDLHTLLELIAGGHGLALLPSSVPVQTAVPLASPRLVHRTELLHGDLSEPAAALLLSNLK